MKKQVCFLILFFLLSNIIASCSSENTTSNQTTENSKTETDNRKHNPISGDVKNSSTVEFSTLFFHPKSGKCFKDKDLTQLFTGSAQEKNSSDQVIRETTFKNGFRIKNETWSDFDGELIQTEDMEYKDGEWYSGWNIKLYKNDELIIVTRYYSYKNGREDKNKSWYISNNQFEDNVSELWIKSEVVCSGGYYPSPKTFPKTKRFFECCESRKLEKFRYKIF
jgi:hypothetical protein